MYYLHSLSAGRMNKLMMVEVYYCPGNQAYFEVLRQGDSERKKFEQE